MQMFFLQNRDVSRKVHGLINQFRCSSGTDFALIGAYVPHESRCLTFECRDFTSSRLYLDILGGCSAFDMLPCTYLLFDRCAASKWATAQWCWRESMLFGLKSQVLSLNSLNFPQQQAVVALHKRIP